MKIKSVGITAVLTAFVLFLGLTTLSAQTPTYYSFQRWDNINQRGDNPSTLVISDPVKNWYVMGESEKADWETGFRASANEQAGYRLMESYQTPVFYHGDSDAFRSLAECREAIQNEVLKFKEEYSQYGNVKIIYVSLYKY